MPKIAKELGALAVQRLTAPGLHFVGGVQGLALHTTHTGARSWLLRAMVHGRRREMGLGSYPDTTLAAARGKARAARELIGRHIDPIAEKNTLRAVAEVAQTFEQCAHAYMTAHESTWKNAKHGQQWRNTLEQYAYPVMGRLPVCDVDKRHVLAALRPIWTTKNETASRLRGRIELVLSYAMQAGYRPEGLNPARWRGGLDKLLPAPGKVVKVEHHAALPAGEMAAFVQRLRAVGGMGARALEFVILTAARSGEARGATWSEIDRKAKVWTIPASRMKAGKEHRVPLSDAALALLDVAEDMPRFAESDLVFPAPRGAMLSDMTLAAVMRRMEVPAVPHGFRSTFRDWAAERTDHPRDVAEMALAHAIGNKVEAAYRRGDLFDKRRQMMSEWATFITTPQRGVVPREQLPAGVARYTRLQK